MRELEKMPKGQASEGSLMRYLVARRRDFLQRRGLVVVLLLSMDKLKKRERCMTIEGHGKGLGGSHRRRK